MEGIIYKHSLPQESLSAFVESFWMLENTSTEIRDVVVLPDGRIDLFFAFSAVEPFHVTLLGISSKAEKSQINPGSKTFAISFKPAGAEYLLRHDFNDLQDKTVRLETDFWDFCIDDLNDFHACCKKAETRIQTLIVEAPDARKLQLFDHIYSSQGEMPVAALSETVSWSPRQINRYFTSKFGIPLKSYCNILRFRASFQQIKQGRLFPESNFTDQSHFIREIKRLSGVLPKDLKKNLYDRFIQFSVMDEQ